MSFYELPISTGEAAARFAALDAFTQGYLTTLFWTSEGVLPDTDELSFDELADTSFETECADFQTLAAATLESLAAVTGEPARQAGIDFLLTRNGHGAGFRDGHWPEPEAAILAALAGRFAQTDLMRGDDGLLYLTPVTSSPLDKPERL